MTMSDLGLLTPNVKRLIILRLSREAIPDGGGLIDGLLFFSDPDKRKKNLDDSARWVKQAIEAVRGGAEPNPWKNASDEVIAGEILQRSADRAGDGAARKLGG
jgi:hypothetical protein